METIEVTRADGGIVTVTLNRPEKKNAINDVMWGELLAALREIAGSDDRVVIAHGRRRRLLLRRRPLRRRGRRRGAAPAPAGDDAPRR